MERPLPLRLLMIAGATAVLGACASQTNPTLADSTLTDISGRSPLELVGLTVESADGTRVLGGVNDLVLAPDNRVEQVIVASGAPAYPVERSVAVDSRAFRFVPSRNALKLTGMSPDEFAELPPVAVGQTMMSMAAARPDGATATGPTNWYGVAPPR